MATNRVGKQMIGKTRCCFKPRDIEIQVRRSMVKIEKRRIEGMGVVKTLMVQSEKKEILRIAIAKIAKDPNESIKITIFLIFSPMIRGIASLFQAALSASSVIKVELANRMVTGMTALIDRALRKILTRR